MRPFFDDAVHSLRSLCAFYTESDNVLDREVERAPFFVLSNKLSEVYRNRSGFLLLEFGSILLHKVFRQPFECILVSATR